jgi:hypothetical protein
MMPAENHPRFCVGPRGRPLREPAKDIASKLRRIVSPTLLVVAVLLQGSLLGCANPERDQERLAAEQAALNDHDDAECRTAGAAPGTARYEDCRRSLIQKRAENEAIQEKRREAFQQTTGAGTSAVSGP